MGFPPRTGFYTYFDKGAIMKVSAISILFTTLVFFHSTVNAGNGPKGGPSFPDYQWTEVVETDFLDPNRWESRAGLQAVELHNHLFVICADGVGGIFEGPVQRFFGSGKYWARFFCVVTNGHNEVERVVSILVERLAGMRGDV